MTYNLFSFKNRAQQVHCDKYTYDNTVYLNIRTHVLITCPIHGDFKATPTNHISRKSGCPKCAVLNRVQNQPKQLDKFITEANLIHSNKFNYENSIYNKANTKIIITCPIHGDFKTTPTNHINRKSGCPECAKIQRTISSTSTSNIFIEKAQQIHKGKYNYSESIYTKAKHQIKIICPTHGSFFQTPNDHLSGYGCSCCGLINQGVYSEVFFENNYKLKNVLGILYAINIHNNNFTYIKIGITRNSVKVRYPGIKVADIIFEIPCRLYSAFKMEQTLLKHFNNYRIVDINQQFPGWTECLTEISNNEFLNSSSSLLNSFPQIQLDKW